MLPILKEDIDSSTVAIEGFLFLRLIMWALSQETVMARKEISLVSLAYHQFPWKPHKWGLLYVYSHTGKGSVDTQFPGSVEDVEGCIDSRCRQSAWIHILTSSASNYMMLGVGGINIFKSGNWHYNNRVGMKYLA